MTNYLMNQRQSSSNSEQCQNEDFTYEDHEALMEQNFDIVLPNEENKSSYVDSRELIEGFFNQLLDRISTFIERRIHL